MCCDFSSYKTNFANRRTNINKWFDVIKDDDAFKVSFISSEITQNLFQVFLLEIRNMTWK